MAQCLLAYFLRQAGRNDIAVASAATSTEELGNPIHPGAQAELQRHSVPIIPHRAVRLNSFDLGKYDIFIGMDTVNVLNMRRILGSASKDKCHRLLDLSGGNRDISDPWYTGDFTAAWNDIEEGCSFLASVL